MGSLVTLENKIKKIIKRKSQIKKTKKNLIPDKCL
jgi:hypothetical protein